MSSGWLPAPVETVTPSSWSRTRAPSGRTKKPMTADLVTVVLISSIAGSPAQWAPQVDHLQPHHDIVAVTLPGHAGADGQDDYSVEALAEYVLAQVEGRDRLVLVGHSGGALIAAHLAAALPDRVVGLLLVDPGTDGRAFSAEQAAPMLAALRSEAYPHVAAEHWSSMLDGASDATRDLALADLEGTDTDVLPDFLEAMGSYDALAPIRAFAASHPVVAVVTPMSEGPHAVVTEADGVEIIQVGGTSHWVQLDRPDVINEALDRLIAHLSE